MCVGRSLLGVGNPAGVPRRRGEGVTAGVHGFSSEEDAGAGRYQAFHTLGSVFLLLC